MLANPELIENFTGKSNLEELVGGSIQSKKASPSKKLAINSAIKNLNNGDIKAIDGDLGIDFSPLIDETPLKTEKTIGEDLPQIAESVDYYSLVFF